MATKERKRLGEILLEQGAIDKHQLKTALNRQQQWGKKLGETLVGMQFLSEEKLAEYLSQHYRIPVIDIKKFGVDPTAAGLANGEFCQLHQMIPIAIRKIKGRPQLVVVAADPSDVLGLDELRFMVNLPVVVGVATNSTIQHAIREVYFRDSELEEITITRTIHPEDEKMQVFREGRVETVELGDEDNVGVERKAEPKRQHRQDALTMLVQMLEGKAILTAAEAEQILSERE